MVSVVLIPNEYSRTMPANYPIFLKYRLFKYIYNNDLRQVKTGSDNSGVTLLVISTIAYPIHLRGVCGKQLKLPLYLRKLQGALHILIFHPQELSR
jgi:hypothetical protein